MAKFVSPKTQAANPTKYTAAQVNPALAGGTIKNGTAGGQFASGGSSSGGYSINGSQYTSGGGKINPYGASGVSSGTSSSGGGSSSAYTPVTQKTGASSIATGQKTALASLASNSSSDIDPATGKPRKKASTSGLSSSANAFNTARESSKDGSTVQLNSGYFQNGKYNIGKAPTAKTPETPKAEPEDKKDEEYTKTLADFEKQLSDANDLPIDMTEQNAADAEYRQAEEARRGYDRDLQTGLENLSQQRIPLEFVTGQQASLQRSAAVQQGNLLDRVATTQARRQAALDNINRIQTANSNRASNRANILNNKSDFINQYAAARNKTVAEAKADTTWVDAGNSKILKDNKTGKTIATLPVAQKAVAKKETPMNKYNESTVNAGYDAGLTTPDMNALYDQVNKTSPKAVADALLKRGDSAAIGFINTAYNTNYPTKPVASKVVAPAKKK